MSGKDHVTFEYPTFTTNPSTRNRRKKIEKTSGNNSCLFSSKHRTQNQNNSEYKSHLRQNEELVLVEKQLIWCHIEKAHQI